MRTIAILNPAADHGRTGKKRSAVQAALHAAGLPSEVWLTQAPGHAVTLARQAAARADAVLAVGGDGTIQEVCRGLIESARAVPLGVIPLGTGNDFVKVLGMPLHPQAAARMLARATPRDVDYGVVRWQEAGMGRQQVFVNAVGVGFDARAAIEAERLKFLPGFTGYLAAVFRTLRRWDSPQARIVGAREPGEAASLLYEGRLLLLTAGNGVSLGGMFRLTPHASITDGLLDVCLVEDARALRIVQVLPRAVRGRHEMAREVHTYRVHTLEITTETGLPIHADGEILAQNAQSIAIDVVPGGLSVLMPM